MQDEPRVYTWFGVNVDELTYTELLAAFKQLAEMYERDNANRLSRLEQMRKVYGR